MGDFKLVDDCGLFKNKPVNVKATELVKLVQGEDYPHQIHGDVALVNDGDF
jgi:hypothetical protein